MGSRIRENVYHLFECFCEVVKPQAGVKDAWIIQKFPDSYKDEEVLKSVPQFSYPCEFDNSVIQHYSFVLTSVDSKWTFGFCRHDPKSSTAVVILSFLPWHEAFYEMLNKISELIHNHTQTDFLTPFLSHVYSSKVPDPGTTMEYPLNNGTNNMFKCHAPKQFQLPSIPENRNLTEYYNAVDCDNMITIFASMLYERRIVFTSKKLYRLSACVQAANAIIYPMNWQHIFIPVLPLNLVDYLLAPMPYLIGVPNALLDKVRKVDVGDVVILDADNNSVETPFDDVSSLPQDVVKQLKTQLRNRAALLGDGVSRAFLRALVHLIGGYRDALNVHQGEKITFNKDAFVESRPPNIQPFLRKMLDLQIFQQFIDERLAMLNAGLGFSDEFEHEAWNYCDKNSSRLKNQYKEWTNAMKKEGSAFFKSVKTRAKERGKDLGKAYKGIKSKFKDFGEDKGRPRSQISTSSGSSSFRKDLLTKQRRSAAPDISQSQAPYTVLTPTSPDHGECSNLQLSPLNMDLMGDLQDVLFNKCSLLDTPVQTPNKIKPVRSFDNFKTGNGTVLDNSIFGESAAAGSDDSVFLLGAKTEHVQKLTPTHKSQVKSSSSDTVDLIRLDSTPSDEFDPLENGELVGHSLTNPLYPYYTSRQASDTHRDMDLLREYGLDFNSISSAPQPLAQAAQSNWTKFE
ncbi:DENN domain-containing protein 1A-like isoform X2 [Cimex lectularius]|uniref:UDENN domain-containing protein n=1 Tax=Cimex lectularius TaxID=79782 RepID=A0A8I6SCD2_CIMLE|nr:DENN domain-containing protein 1A-like isoform X2 [Cimex lectularius]